jgi:hypothetical protein
LGCDIQRGSIIPFLFVIFTEADSQIQQQASWILSAFVVNVLNLFLGIMTRVTSAISNGDLEDNIIYLLKVKGVHLMYFHESILMSQFKAALPKLSYSFQIRSSTVVIFRKLYSKHQSGRFSRQG